MGTRSWDFDYLIGGLEEVVFAVGRTTQVAFDYKSESTIPISDELRKDLENRFERPLAFKEAT
jgi:acyl-CoA thioesterase FadM